MLVQTCDQGSFDASTQTCASPVWVESPGVLPPLSAGDGALVGGAIVLCWCIGFAFRIARKVVFPTL